MLARYLLHKLGRTKLLELTSKNLTEYMHCQVILKNPPIKVILSSGRTYEYIIEDGTKSLYYTKYREEGIALLRILL